MAFATADLFDKYGEDIQIALPLFNNYGGRQRFSGPAATVKVFEDNALVAETLAQSGNGRVLIVAGGGSLYCALVGGNLAQLAKDNGWQGIIVYGCIRDTEEIAAVAIGVKALNVNPRRGTKIGGGQHDITVTFADVKIAPGNYVYADEDGIVIASKQLTL